MATRMPTIGPCSVTSYPLRAWSKCPIDGNEIWKLVGPTFDLLIDKMPLWQVFVSIYLEGVMHGADAQRETSHG